MPLKNKGHVKKKTKSQKKADAEFISKVSTINIGGSATGELHGKQVTVSPPTPMVEFGDGTALGVGVVHCEHGNPIGVAVGPIKKHEKPYDDSGEVSVTA